VIYGSREAPATMLLKGTMLEARRVGLVVVKVVKSPSE
jgi:hypothetical protein